VASRLARAMDRFAALAEPYRSQALVALRRVAAAPKLSSDTREVLERTLEVA
jgi:aminopeptidase N